MFQTSFRTLKILAAAVWYAGVVMLIAKSAGLLTDAVAGGTHPGGIAAAAAAGLIIGWLKARYLFEKICIRNLERIRALKKPLLWQFYRPRFFLFLFFMVLSGRWLAEHSQGNTPMLLGLAVLELSVAVALALSSRCFHRF